MLNFIFNQILFYISIAVMLFIPGYFLLLAIFGKSKILSALEKFTLSFGLSIIAIDIILILNSGYPSMPILSCSLLSLLLFYVTRYFYFEKKNQQKIRATPIIPKNKHL